MLFRKCSIRHSFFSFFSFSVCSMLAWVGRCLLDGISSSIMVLSESFFQVQSLQIILHNLAPSLVWSSPYCRTINHQTSTFANLVLSFYPFYVANPLESKSTEMSCIASLSPINTGSQSQKISHQDPQYNPPVPVETTILINSNICTCLQKM